MMELTWAFPFTNTLNERETSYVNQGPEEKNTNDERHRHAEKLSKGEDVSQTADLEVIRQEKHGEYQTETAFFFSGDNRCKISDGGVVNISLC